MLFKGIALNKPKPELVCLPHEDSPDGVVPFTVNAITDPTPFMERYPKPKPTKEIFTKGTKIFDENDPKYLSALAEYWSAMEDWVILEAIKDTPDLVFQTVNMDDITTLGNWKKEMVSSGFSLTHINHLQNLCMRKACLSSAMIEEATENFTRSKR